MKIRFHSHVNLTHFHMNGCAPGLALIERLKATRKWAIQSTNLCPGDSYNIFELRDQKNLLNTSIKPKQQQRAEINLLTDFLSKSTPYMHM